MNTPTRRSFLKAGLTAAAATASTLSASPASKTGPAQVERSNPLPRWRGFNLLPFFSHNSRDPRDGALMVRELDLKWIRDWGFDYIRLPFDYWLFVNGSWPETGRMDPDDLRNLNEANLARLDRAVELCGRFGLHLNVNMHRAPGYCINGWNTEPFNLFKNKEAQEHFVFFWDLLAKRYSGISSENLSFNLVNEAPKMGDKMSASDYRRVMLAGRDAIRAVSPDRVIIIDGTGVGREVVTNLIGEDLAQAFHAYDPHPLTHYKADWVGDNSDWPVPQYPYPEEDGTLVDKRIMAIRLAPWAEAVRRGIGVHCSEFGCYKYTPHNVFLPWIGDVLQLLKQWDIGWALWNFRGDFGILDSGRPDVRYEDWYGHQLDRQLLNLLQQG